MASIIIIKNLQKPSLVVYLTLVIINIATPTISHLNHSFYPSILLEHPIWDHNYMEMSTNIYKEISNFLIRCEPYNIRDRNIGVYCDDINWAEVHYKAHNPPLSLVKKSLNTPRHTTLSKVGQFRLLIEENNEKLVGLLTKGNVIKTALQIKHIV